MAGKVEYAAEQALLFQAAQRDTDALYISEIIFIITDVLLLCWGS